MESVILFVAVFLGVVSAVGTALALGVFLGLVYGQWYYDGAERTGARAWPALRAAGLLGGPLRRYFLFRTNAVLDAHLAALAPPDAPPYVFACHPHGVFALGAVLAFGLNRTAVAGRVLGAVHSGVFWVPLLRDVALWCGAVEVTRATMTHVLTEQRRSVALVPGGVREMLEPSGGQLPAIQRHRGFLRLAYEHQVSVVPVYLKGEDALFWTWQGLRGLRDAFVDLVGYPFPTFFVGPLPRPLAACAAEVLRPAEYGTLDAFAAAYDCAMLQLVRRETAGEAHLVQG